jgi:carbon-monoxide dehydrogenase medium subunit
VGIRDEGDELVIGAMTSHYEVMTSDLIRQHCGLLAKATSTVADPQVRHRGTFGGALSHADPAGDLPAVALAFGTTMVVAGPDGRREVPASEFFADYLQTALGPADVLVEVRVPKLDAGAGWGYHYEKFQRVARPGPSLRWPRWSAGPARCSTRRDSAWLTWAPRRCGPAPRRTPLAGARANDSAVADAAALAAEGTSPPQRPQRAGWLPKAPSPGAHPERGSGGSRNADC